MTVSAAQAEDLGDAARAIATAEHLLVTAGAGVGVDSGLPDFRGTAGFWQAYPPYRDQGLSFSSMADPRWFAQDPEIGWGFYGHRLNLYRATQPHRGFGILLDWARAKRSFFVFTSNVDGQFQQAGFPPDRIYEVHGSIHHLQCTTPCCDEVYSADGTKVLVDDQTMRARAPLPTCPRCSALARPNILMFGDFAYLSTRDQGQAARYRDWLTGVGSDSLAIVEVGAGSAIPTVRYEGEQLLGSHDGTLIRINPREAQVPGGSRCVGIAAGGLEAIELIEAARRDG